jgi:hypothetical protein
MRSFLISLALLCTSCAAPAVDPTPPAAMPRNAEEATAQDTCHAAQFRALLGKLDTEIDQTALPPHTRIIRPGMMVTQDFSPQRLNVHVGPDHRIAALDCF